MLGMLGEACGWVERFGWRRADDRRRREMARRAPGKVRLGRGPMR
jgi:hypothetical protein